MSDVLSGPMRNLFLLCIAVWSVVACAPVVSTVSMPSATPSVAAMSFDLTKAPIRVGSVFTANIRLDNVAGLVGVELQVAYDPAILEMQDADSGKDGVQSAWGTFLKPDLVAQNLAVPAQGKMGLAAVQLPPSQSVSGSGVLATIAFKARSAGSSPLTFDLVNLSTSSGTPIEHVLQNAQVQVRSK
jgi:Cohesin domain